MELFMEQLYSYKVYKNGKKYVDLCLVWDYENKVICVRVLPRFNDKSWNVLLARSIKVQNAKEVYSRYRELSTK